MWEHEELETESAQNEDYVALELDQGLSHARHPDYGAVFMVGCERGKPHFMHLRKLGDKLRTDGVFGVDRMRW